jgi:hypothetical protein
MVLVYRFQNKYIHEKIKFSVDEFKIAGLQEYFGIEALVK